ncbi:MAG: hypothetical protein M1814_006685 [Vezdaea aestivalis]|nr:MAG: hypothetical protein M1814_006685 [Vezdaea aestivalis]
MTSHDHHSQRDSERHRRKHRTRTRSRSPAKESRHKKRSRRASPSLSLPLDAFPLHKNDFNSHKNLFARYLDVQKQLFLKDIPEDEVRGRWKSFVKRWNSANLAEGWYDTDVKKKADEEAAADEMSFIPRTLPDYEERLDSRPSSKRRKVDSSDDEEFLGPVMPIRKSSGHNSDNRDYGPTIPNKRDLQVRDEDRIDDDALAQADLKYARKIDRRLQHEALDELAPKADAGSHERRLEKRQEVTAKLRGYGDDKGGGELEEVGDRDLLGGIEDSVDAFKRRKEQVEGKKTERAIRKEEILRSRTEERAQKVQAYREKESKTMDMLRDLAKKRFG